MKTIPISDFQKNLYDSIKELPCLITKNGKPFLRVEAFSEEQPKIATIRPVKIAIKPKRVATPDKGNYNSQLCEHGCPSGLCKRCFSKKWK